MQGFPSHVHPPHNNSSVHLTTTKYVPRCGRIADGMRSGLTTLKDSEPSSPTLVLTLCQGPSQLQPGPAITASPLPLAIANGSGCPASRRASPTDLPWHPSLQHLHLLPANHRLQKVYIR